jgi:Helix-turn-helix domain
MKSFTECLLKLVPQDPPTVAQANGRARRRRAVTAKSTPINLPDKVRLIERMGMDGRLSHADFRTLAMLLFSFHNTKTGQCNPGHERLAQASATSKSTARAAIENGEALGYLAATKSRGGRCRSNHYKFNETCRPSAPLEEETCRPSAPLEHLNVPIHDQKRADPRSETCRPSAQQIRTQEGTQEGTQGGPEGVPHDSESVVESEARPQEEEERAPFGGAVPWAETDAIEF